MLCFATCKVYKTDGTLREGETTTQSLYFDVYGNILSLSFVVNVVCRFWII